ncbi:MAG: RnfABCDGE type electron transport complex subunit D [Paracoccus sp. (in: a-proteobacteria)]|uniref:RnfABCDGE type electron transport complex subunit D n=1 Tax=Paracoccus sp. TaxID=267 RepID=UPI0026E0EBB6|nr:RnfABCDGE type electron transport complex subunit D [Paracoccus sp. (in: a-proteobacteria)]MDO5611786.1 RnfABCDGE type electron transport complex subunit D [Paracoccus sp. (in: a-proteobacteria)]
MTVTKGIWSRETVALILIAAMLPIVITWLLAAGPAVLSRLVFVLVLAGLWHLAFMLARAQPPSFAGALSAIAIALLAPPQIGPVALLLSVSFGVVVAELIFGGWGRNILNPATVTLAFVSFGFPAEPWATPDPQIGWAAIPAALIGMGFGVISARLIGGALIGAGLAALAGWPLAGSFATAALVVLVMLVADPVASAATRLGRWLTGGLFALLMAGFAAHWTGGNPVQIAVSAALLTSLAAPLLDETALAFWRIARRKRLGL